MGFGFISGEGGFNHSSLGGTAIEVFWVGQTVTYEERCGPKIPRAEKVRPQ
jgi:cold shock CspA family protein